MKFEILKKIVKDIVRTGFVKPSAIKYAETIDDDTHKWIEVRVPTLIDIEGSAFLGESTKLSMEECKQKHSQYIRVMQKALNLLQHTLMSVDIDYYLKGQYSVYKFQIKESK
tara:strand:+ start:969 stop:1304 length:336 start_codon:yes stop_codon:yes gene_type:complete